MPKARSATAVVLLTIITVGLYWFYWAGTSFSEIARNEQRPMRVGAWVFWLVALSVPIAAIAIYDGIGLARILVDGGDLEAWALEPHPWWIQIINVVVTDAFLVAQFFFLRDGTRMLRDATLARSLPKPPRVGLVFSMTLLGIIGLLPLWGSFFAIASVIVWIVWNVQVQNSMNRYWKSTTTAAA
jgi:hypothetical protein